MKIFLSYGHDSNTPLIEKIKDYLSKDEKGNPKHEVWIDTSENKEHLSSNTVIQNLLKVVNILQEKVKRLEYALDCQMDSGDFTNNQYNYYMS